ncbi:hypothetical protein [Pelagerythrobacter rhizovicinus]|uniref:Uncharacterized protein n=1 Tax=Pelagerythrobacter rhizovicinus TaxID=2268576 RepID=A0A4Q2KN85_9SPHN|nr:hypothetical protein [Pelagerythrobacter rhizovicinus]RXZ66009.1 hypothetical protein ETX26_04635 [Pelagerythrobacter rhizovicinus]
MGVLFACAFVAACSNEHVVPVADEIDPAVAAALNDQILTDPDLSRQNEGSAALTGGVDHALPLVNDSPRASDAAREEALALLGGRDRLLRLPPVAKRGEEVPLKDRITVTARAAYAGASERCVRSLRRGFIWAARMPAQFPVYPRGATQEAAGNDVEGCTLRAVNFRTPVPPKEVLAFYHTRALGAGFSSTLTVAGEETVLSGRRGDASFAVYARTGPSGLTDIDLVTRGL